MGESRARATDDRVLAIDGVSKSYGTVKALDGVSFDVRAGEFCALLGPNGAGKTTLFQLLTGLFVADAGRIEVEGLDIRREMVRVLADIGVVFQQPTLDLDLTVGANLRFHTRLHGMPRHLANSRIAAELDRLGIGDTVHSVCRTLSGGNRRKVELARALLHQPRILLMDEATVGLDPASRRMLVGYVRSLCQERRLGVLWTTHLVDEVEHANQVVLLNRGRVMRLTTPAEMLRLTGAATLADAFMALTGDATQLEGESV
ncbi:MAG: ABC transporter ATP-binding protein [Thiotrichales bacterium]